MLTFSLFPPSESLKIAHVCKKALICFPFFQENECFFESEFISVDPYQRYMAGSMTPPCTMAGSVVAVITDSRNKDFPKGARVVAYCGWVKRGE